MLLVTKSNTRRLSACRYFINKYKVKCNNRVCSKVLHKATTTKSIHFWLLFRLKEGKRRGWGLFYPLFHIFITIPHKEGIFIPKPLLEFLFSFFYFLFFYLIQKKKFENRPIADHHVSVRPANIWKTKQSPSLILKLLETFLSICGSSPT